MPRSSQTVNFEINGVDVAFIRGQSKRLRLRVSPANTHVVVTGPASFTAAQARSFVLQHWDWLTAARARVAARSHAARPELAEGQTANVWGKPFQVAFSSPTRPPRAVVEAGRLVFSGLTSSSAPEAKRQALERLYAAQVRAAIAREAPGVEARVGATASEWKVRHMVSKWGVCRDDGRITMSSALGALNPVFLAEVMAHELVHLFAQNHGPEFQSRMDAARPTWRLEEAALKMVTPLRVKA
jgi:predicted metal-dependent hydrolase